MATAIPSAPRANVELEETFVRRHPGACLGPHVMLAVQDTGEGMDAATQARLFEPFFTTKDVGKGTGLGLASVYGIVKQSEGYIAVDSAPGHGTTFMIYLPKIEPAAEPGEPKTTSPELPRRSETLPRVSLASPSEMVLLLEDEADVRDFLQEVLQESGYAVLAVGRPSEALRSAEEHAGRIRLLITDVVMPEMSGRELAERMLAAHPMLKVLYVSGYAGDMIARHGVSEGGPHFLAKPFTADALARKVREVLSAP